MFPKSFTNCHDGTSYVIEEHIVPYTNPVYSIIVQNPIGPSSPTSRPAVCQRFVWVGDLYTYGKTWRVLSLEGYSPARNY